MFWSVFAGAAGSRDTVLPAAFLPDGRWGANGLAQDEVSQEGAMVTVVAYNINGGCFEETFALTATPIWR